MGDEIPRRLGRASVGPLFFDVIGVRPLVGRFFRDEDAAAEAAPVVVLSSEFWREAFGADAAVVGRRLTIDDRPHEVIGVAPSGIAIPNDDVRLWTTARVTRPVAPDDTRVELTRAIARLAPGATTEQASAEGTILARSVTRPIAYDMLFGKGGPVEVNVRTLSDQLTLRVRSALLLLLSGVGLLLLITCANVANLFLSRGAARDREYAVRVALGAARGRLVREALAESIVLSMLGGMVGLALAVLLVSALPLFAPQDFPRLDSVAVEWRTLAFAFATALASALLTGLAPASMRARADLLPSLRNGVGASAGPRGMRPQRVLLVSEAALAMMLLVGAALMGRSFVNLLATDAGYDPANVLTARIYLPGAARGEADSGTFVNELLERVRALPGVVTAGASNMAPFGRSTYVSAFEVAPPGREKVTARAQSYVVTPGYVEALRLRLRQGRLLQPSDVTASGPRAVLVNDEFVRLFLGGTDPLRIQFNGQHGVSAIVGVVGNVLRGSLDQQPQAEMYVLEGRGNAIRREIYLLARTQGDPAPYAAEVRQLVAALRSNAAVEGIEPLTTQLSASVAQPRFAAAVLLSLAGVALLLASIGLYGVLSYWVARRQREIGIRSALGATTRDIVRSILGEGVILTGLGLGVGVALAAAATRLMRTLLVGVGTLDPLSFVLAGAALLIVAIAASAAPARRATRVDAVIALRAE